MSAIVANKTSTGQARLLVQQQIVSVPNDRGARDQCLNNNSFVAAVDPIMTGRGGCGYGTTDCRYVLGPLCFSLSFFLSFFSLSLSLNIYI